MTEEQFKSLMRRAEELASGEYLAGYQRGLRRRYYGATFSTAAEHQQWLALDNDRAELRRGYRDGFAAVPVEGAATGCERVPWQWSRLPPHA